MLLTNGRVRVERSVVRDQVHTYQSASFCSAREAREWIKRQDAVPSVPSADYSMTPTDRGTYRVILTHGGGGAAEMLGEFANAADAGTFIRRMRGLDNGKSQGSGPD